MIILFFSLKIGMTQKFASVDFIGIGDLTICVAYIQEPSVARQWHVSGTSVARQWHVSGTSVARQWHVSDTSVARQWHVSGTSVARQWHVSGTYINTPSIW